MDQFTSPQRGALALGVLIALAGVAVTVLLLVWGQSAALPLIFIAGATLAASAAAMISSLRKAGTVDPTRRWQHFIVPGIGLALMAIMLCGVVTLSGAVSPDACLGPLVLVWLAMVMHTAFTAGGIPLQSSTSPDQTPQHNRYRSLYIFFVFLLAVGVIVMAALARNDPTAPPVFTEPAPAPLAVIEPWRCVVGGAIFMIAAVVVFALNRRYGPLVVGQSQQGGAAPTPRPNRWRRIFPYLAFVLAVGVITMAALARNEPDAPCAPDQDLCPEPAATNLLLATPGLQIPALAVAGGAVVVSLVVLVLVRSEAQRVSSKPIEPARFEDISEAHTPPPVLAQSLWDTLIALGFMRLGELRSRDADTDVLHTAWLLTSEDRRTTALFEMVEGQIAPTVVLLSYFPPLAAVETYTVMAPRVSDPDYRMDWNNQGLHAALEQHRRTLVEFDARHGKPAMINTMREFVDLHQHTILMHRPKAVRASIQQAYAFHGVTLVIGLAALGLAAVLGQWLLAALSIMAFSLLIITVEARFIIATLQQRRRQRQYASTNGADH